MKRFSSLVLLALLATMLVTSAQVRGQAGTVRVNAGAFSPYTDAAGNVWQPDKYYAKGGGYGFIGGETEDRGEDTTITGAKDVRIYQTERYGMSGFVAEVPNGNYTIRLHFAETYSDIAYDGPRVFGVKLQGQAILEDFDVSKAAGGTFKPVVKEFSGIAVTDGTLKLDFVARSQNPEINGIEIIAE
jgi:endoglucanase